MVEAGIDFAAVFQALPGAVALLTPQLVFAEANEKFLRQAGRSREQVVGRYLFDAFPRQPHDAGTSRMRDLEASLRRVLAGGEGDVMAVQRYDVEVAPGRWEERYWSPVNAPVFAPDGRVVLVIHRVEDVTALIRATGGPGAELRVEAELYSRLRELEEVNQRLRVANEREREVGLALQSAMLPPARPIRAHRTAVRYRPATAALNVCGDWYDLIPLPGGDRTAVTVGDVVGHGLAAAVVMGQLRSALSAASLVADGPARALDALGRYAHFLDGAESTTAVTCFLDWDERTITYSSAGHPPPVLLRANGTAVLLDDATDPPLDAHPEPTPRPQATTVFADGDVLALYTDGLIERRGQDIDTGLTALIDSLARHHAASGPDALDPDTLADAVLADLLPPGGVTDDTALVIVRL
ncbi:PP2C family protein-serine/threonine phosphatase [Kitasatospora sp. DSM 101779]|uniref:PP2C family protein-serine/threonine phosphatase n=1 Tax=Kitasatospora sp. DSM 101779 TaxID=2853165 RepID=UPI0021D8EDDF|nr:SpoIIE family protein phosphatase [Kitasatospora sp. DSM 101779]MCU7827362.1 SpoIIE family protein phosphatase [Kitasatospora sp. DSM 101779]